MINHPNRVQDNTGMSVGHDDVDRRLEFIYREAVRGLDHQQGVVESMSTRAGNLIFATAFANSLLGGAAISNGLGRWDWIAVTLLFCIGGLVVFMLWPWYQYTFRFDPEELQQQYVDVDQLQSMSTMHRALALRIKSDMANNWRIIQRLRMALQIALVLLLFNILAWLFAVASV